MTAEAKQAAGISEGLIRVSVGLEDINEYDSRTSSAV